MISYKSMLLGAALLLPVLFASCDPHNGANEEGDKNYTTLESNVEIGAYIVQGNEGKGSASRVHLGPDMTYDHSLVTKIFWTAGDEVACWNSEEKVWAPYYLISGANTTDATFKGKAVHRDDDKEGQLALRVTYGIFPLEATYYSTKDGKYDELPFPGDLPSSIYFKMPSVQKYQAPIDGNPTFGTQYNVMTGKGDGTGMTYFRSTGGILMLRVRGSSFLNRIYKFKITSNLPEPLWGSFEASIGDGGASTVIPTAETIINGHVVEAGTNSLILDCSEYFGSHQELPTTTYTNFYFIVPYGVFTQGFKVEMDTDGDGEFDDGTIITRKNNMIIQSDIKVMPALELTENINLTWDLDDLYEQGTVTEF